MHSVLIISKILHASLCFCLGLNISDTLVCKAWLNKALCEILLQILPSANSVSFDVGTDVAVRTDDHGCSNSLINAPLRMHGMLQDALPKR